jgi:hypothetical protein
LALCLVNCGGQVGLIEEAKTMTKHEAICALVAAIERIESSWKDGSLADAVKMAIRVKDEICQQFDVISGVD